MKSLVAMFFVVMISAQALAANECSSLKQELKSLQKAQTVMMNSLVNNHESFAVTMEEYSLTISENTKKAASVAPAMDKSAAAFRHRGFQGKKMAAQLEKATADLVARLSACL